jgi:2'-5' RNA ligase
MPVAMPDLLRPGPDELRAFFALIVNAVTLSQLARLRDRLLRLLPHRDNARPLNDASLHLTLKFLGNVKRTALPELTQALANALPQQPLEAKLERLVAFGTPKHARVIAIELSESTGELQRAAESLDVAAAAFGVPQETRAFVPHLSLIRLRNPEDLRLWLDKTPLLPQLITFEAARLYETELTATGSRYHAHADYPLPLRSS